MEKMGWKMVSWSFPHQFEIPKTVGVASDMDQIMVYPEKSSERERGKKEERRVNPTNPKYIPLIRLHPTNPK